jgi:putative flippase GtrA
MILSRQTFWQLMRYGLVGVTINGLGYLAYLGVTALGVPPKLAMTGLYAVGTGLAFWGNRAFTFSDNGEISSAALRFLGVYALGWVLNLLILMVFVDYFGASHALVQGMAILLVAGFIFVAQRVFVFRSHS